MLRPCFSVFAVLWCCWAAGADCDAADVSFRDDVEPILRRHCVRCHGERNQEAGLQLNLRSSVLESHGGSVVTAHQPETSLLLRRVTDDAEGDVMPPDAAPLSPREIKTLRRWIEAGAPWPDEFAEPRHWAYQPIVRPPIPQLESSAEESHASDRQASQAQRSHAIEVNGDLSAIDRFILRRLSRHQLKMSPPADRARLLRRLSLAITGLPPTPGEVEAFLRDPSVDALENVVDRLLQSPGFGERWAVPWLDLARYADSNGFQADQIRDNWAYRDWVIRAINEDLPFDQFVTDQIAGDLRENPTVDQRVATGFHRMTTCNVEAGVHPEANRVNQVVDRVNTTATVFLGTTLECAQCHDHKYDPFSQRDYYRFFAYFNNTPLEVENTSGVTWDFYGPTMDLPLGDRQQLQRQRLQARLDQLKHERQTRAQASDGEFQAWLKGLRESSEVTWTPTPPQRFETTGDEDYRILDDGAVLLTGNVPDTVEHTFVFSGSGQTDPITAIRLDVLTDKALPGQGPGRGDVERTNIILSEITCEVVRNGRKQSIKLQDAAADFSQNKWDVAGAIDGNRKTGWAIAPQFGQPHWASFVLSEPLSLQPDDEFHVGLGQYYGRGRVIGKPRLSFYDGETEFLNLDPKLRKLAAKNKLSKKESELLRAEFDQNNPKLRQLDREISAVARELESLAPETTLVMTELEQPRETAVMIRGDYENLGESVSAGTPQVLPHVDSIPKTGDRMELARWLTAEENPLLARVTVNRWWGELFGAGLVRTPEDFGTQGEMPTHPELLDWLASELIDSGWSRKHVIKLIVMSQAFQQSARVTESLRELDPENRLLARGPRFRLSAEVMRDSLLAISGLLSEKMYGPPVMPFQPDNIWRSVGRNQPTWKAATDEDRFRRGLYVIWKRAAPYPSFLNFDAPDRSSCTVARGRSNTPLQALTLLNDPAYAEMALALADRILQQAPESDDRSRLTYAMQLAVARQPSTLEVQLLQELLESERQRLREEPSLATARTRVPFDAMQPQTEDHQELAAWFAVANALLNLDETISQ